MHTKNTNIAIRATSKKAIPRSELLTAKLPKAKSLFEKMEFYLDIDGEPLKLIGQEEPCPIDELELLSKANVPFAEVSLVLGALPVLQKITQGNVCWILPKGVFNKEGTFYLDTNALSAAASTIYKEIDIKTQEGVYFAFSQLELDEDRLELTRLFNKDEIPEELKEKENILTSKVCFQSVFNHYQEEVLKDYFSLKDFSYFKAFNEYTIVLEMPGIDDKMRLSPIFIFREILSPFKDPADNLDFLKFFEKILEQPDQSPQEFKEQFMNLLKLTGGTSRVKKLKELMKSAFSSVDLKKVKIYKEVFKINKTYFNAGYSEEVFDIFEEEELKLYFSNEANISWN